MNQLVIDLTQPGTPSSDEIVRTYMTDVMTLHRGRPVPPEDVDGALASEPYLDLQGETGAFLTAVEDGAGGYPVACVGVRFLGDVAELTKVFTRPGARGRGVSRQLIARVEELCRERGIHTLRLDTHSRFAAACALYERLGFVQTAPHNDVSYADRWYAKQL
ncbi:GNAT family N-acetyltransferase [Marisediminicola senii]|uniref:GNAT family N-acetyltransferase n=1 Tax=Marisediminicola senii TaxID=2711233 RepID=UPI0013EDB498|nr:GNAT family N-acetyltransferase [Marisediminicola senii]